MTTITDLAATARREAGNTYEGSDAEQAERLESFVLRYVGLTAAISKTCAAMVPLAREHADWQTIACNRPMTDEETAREEDVSWELGELLTDLPETDRGPFRLELQGDPRGCTVRLLAPEHDAEQGQGFGVDA